MLWRKSLEVAPVKVREKPMLGMASVEEVPAAFWL